QIGVVGNGTLSGGISFGFVEAKLPGLPAISISSPRTFRQDALAGFVLNHGLAKGWAFRRRIFRMRVIVVKTRAVRKHEVAFDFLETERTILVDLVVSRLVRVLHQSLGAKTARVEMRVLQLVVPFHMR